MIDRKYNWKRFWTPREASLSFSGNSFPFYLDSNPDILDFSQIDNIPCLVLLGEPGVGKSHVVQSHQQLKQKELANSADEIVVLDLRAYGSEDRLVRNLFEGASFTKWLDGQHNLYLYLDSLDECLLRIDTLSALLVDELHSRVKSFDRLYLRVVCRATDWPISLELNLKQFWGKENVQAFNLAPLRHNDIHLACEANNIDPEQFLSDVRQKEVIAFAIRPMTLRLLLNIYKREGKLPDTKSAIYYEGCLLLCEEPKENLRRRNPYSKLTATQRLTVASRIAAVTIFAKRYAISTALDDGGISVDNLKISELVGRTEVADGNEFLVDEAAIMETVATGLFATRGSQLVGWSHQTFTEYLAAIYVARNYTSTQIRSFLFDGDGKLVPQLVETAAWIAVENQDILSDVMHADPTVLLRSDLTSQSNEVKANIVEALLEEYEKEAIRPNSYRTYYTKLQHPNLTQQLDQYLRANPQGVFGRFAAINIAEECELAGLDDTLVKLALDQSVLGIVRVQAAGYVANFGSDDNIAKLRPLALVRDLNTAEDELKYAVIPALWPRFISVEELFEHLVPVNFDDDRVMTTRVTVLPQLVKQLDIQHLPTALTWTRQFPRRFGLSLTFQDVLDEIMLAGWRNWHVPHIRMAFAKAALARLERYDAIVGERGRGIDGDKVNLEFFQDVQNNLEKRRGLFLDLLNIIADEKMGMELMSQRASLVSRLDIEWLIELYQREHRAIQRAILSNMIERFHNWYIHETHDVVFRACLHDAELHTTLGMPFAIVHIHSEKASKLKTAHQKAMARQSQNKPEPPLQPPPPQQIELRLQECENGDLDKWVYLVASLSLEPHHSRYWHDWRSDLTERVGWRDADKETRNRILTAAQQFVIEKTPEENDWITTNSYPHTTLAGYQALRLLASQNHESLLKIPTQAWEKWTPIILDYPNESGEMQQFLAYFAYVFVPDTFIAEAISKIEREDASGHLYSLSVFDKCWDEKFTEQILQKLRDSTLSSGGRSTLLHSLLDKGSTVARAYAEKQLNALNLLLPEEREVAMQISMALLTGKAGFDWSLIWKCVVDNREFGMELFERAGYFATREVAFPTQLNELQLADLYIWLAEIYPHAEDPDEKGFHEITRREEVGHLRDSLLHHHLIGRGTPKSAAAIERISKAFPHLDLRSITRQAQEQIRRLQWTPIEPATLLMISKHPDLGLVQNGDQLLQVVIESLERLQRNLFGEAGIVRNVWDYQAASKTFRPHSENDLSAFIKHHFDNDIANRGIVANCEVQIRRGKQRTDIHVNAVVPAATPNQYDTITVIIEVKGCWNKGVLTAMQDQLVDRYLHENSCGHGLYLVGWFLCEQWDETDSRKKAVSQSDIEQLRTKLNTQAKGLSQNGNIIEAFVLNCQLK